MTDLFYGFDDAIPPHGDYLAAIRLRLRDPSSVERVQYQADGPTPHLIGSRIYTDPVPDFQLIRTALDDAAGEP